MSRGGPHGQPYVSKAAIKVMSCVVVAERAVKVFASVLTLKALNYFCINHGDQIAVSNLKSSQKN